MVTHQKEKHRLITNRPYEIQGGKYVVGINLSEANKENAWNAERSSPASSGRFQGRGGKACRAVGYFSLKYLPPKYRRWGGVSRDQDSQPPKLSRHGNSTHRFLPKNINKTNLNEGFQTDCWSTRTAKIKVHEKLKASCVSCTQPHAGCALGFPRHHHTYLRHNISSSCK